MPQMKDNSLYDEMVKKNIIDDLRKVHNINIKKNYDVKNIKKYLNYAGNNKKDYNYAGNNKIKKDYNEKYLAFIGIPPFREQSPKSDQPQNPAQSTVAEVASSPSVDQYVTTGPNPQRPTPPENPTPGDVWLNTNTGKINVWTGTTWLEITTPIGATPIGDSTQPKPELPKIGRKIIVDK